MAFDFHATATALKQYCEITHRIRDILEKVANNSDWNFVGGFGLSWFTDNGEGGTGKDFIDVVFTNVKGGTSAVQFPMEWLDPTVNLYTVNKDEFRHVF